MNLHRAAELLEVNIREARPSVMGGEPQVTIPASMARLYLDSMRNAERKLDANDQYMNRLLGRRWQG